RGHREAPRPQHRRRRAPRRLPALPDRRPAADRDRLLRARRLPHQPGHLALRVACRRPALAARQGHAVGQLEHAVTLRGAGGRLSQSKRVPRKGAKTAKKRRQKAEVGSQKAPWLFSSCLPLRAWRLCETPSSLRTERTTIMANVTRSPFVQASDGALLRFLL